MTGAPTHRNAETQPAPSERRDTEIIHPTLQDVLDAVERACTKIDALEASFDEGIEVLRSEMRVGLEANANGMLNLEQALQQLRSSHTKDVETLFAFRRETRDRLQRISEAAAGE